MQIDLKLMAEKDEDVTNKMKNEFPLTKFFFFLSIEFIIAITILWLIKILNIIKSVLPKPPRDLNGAVVLIIGATSRLGVSLAEEFAKRGCSIIFVDRANTQVKQLALDLQSRYTGLKNDIKGSQRKEEKSSTNPKMIAYQCEIMNHDEIRELTKKIHNEIGGIDIIISCIHVPCQDIFDSTSLMNYYRTILALLPLTLNREQVYIIGVTPVLLDKDADINSRTAIASLMECLGQELSNYLNNITFLAISPTTDTRSIKPTEQEVAREVVKAVRRDQSSLTYCLGSSFLYRTSCLMYVIIQALTGWYQD